MIHIDELIKQLEKYRYNYKFEYDLAIHSPTHLSLCIVSDDETEDLGLFSTKLFTLPINKSRMVDEHQIIKYIIEKFN